MFWNKKVKESDESLTNGIRLITYYEPKNVISEQLRTVRTNIEFAGAALDEMKVVMFTSPEMSDGKSTVSANVAVTWAQAGKKVLMVDADMRRPTTHLTFNELNLDGLSSILSATKTPEDVVKATFVENLSVITSGPVPPNPAELLGSKHMHDFMAWARANYDIVVLDATPVLAVADVQVSLPEVDGVVLVVRMEKTLKGNIARTVEVLKMSDTPVLGVVERTQKSKGDSGYGYGYGYGYGDGSNGTK